MGKGDAAAQRKIDNAIASTQLAYQQKVLQQYIDYTNALKAGGGYLPGVKQSLVSTATQQIPGAYQGIARNLQTAALSRGIAGGGNLPGAGNYLNNYGQLLSAEELAKSNALNQITAQGQQNIAGAESGVLQAGNIYANTGSNALSNATSAANASTQASTGLTGALVGGGLGVLGKIIDANPKNVFG